MLNIEPTYNLKQSAGSMPVVLYRSEVKESKARKFVATALVVASVGIVSLQTGFVLDASANGNPISSPISSAPISGPQVNPTPNSNSSNGNNPSNNGGNNGSSNNSGGSSASSCNNEAPKAPKIVSAITTGKNEITLNWEKPVGNVTHYSVSYGLVKGKPLYGVANVGNVNSFKVSGLGGGVTYYFIVKAVNDCTPSVASNEAAVKVGGKFINTPAVGFKAGVLGQANVVKANVSGKPALAKPVFFNNVTENKPVSAGFAGKVVSFFKGLFN